MNRIQEANRLLAENLVESIIKDYDACGVAAAIIDKNGVTQYEKFWGSKELGTGEKPDGETIFGLASVTKSFTALAIMQMEERGILNLDDPVSKYVPEFTNKNQKTVTIRHLLSHSGGFFPLPRILIDEVAAEHVGKATVCKLNIDQAQQIASRYGVMSIPTVMLFKNGEEVERAVGFRPKHEIVRILNL